MALLYLAALAALLAPLVSSSFELFAFYEKSTAESFYGLSSGCIDVLNSTDQNTATLVGQGVDSNYWFMDNITALCTTECGDSLSSWLASVESACAGDNVTQSSVQVQAKAITLQFAYNYDLACLRNSAGDWCFFDSQDWQRSDYVRWDTDHCLYDPLPPECNNTDFSVTDISPEMAALTNLYPSSFYCSNCFLELYRKRLQDPWLVKSNFTDYLIGQFDDVQKNCSTTLPYTTSSSTLYLASITPSPTAPFTATNASATCTGQLLAPLETPLICNDLSDSYNVTTGDSRVATNDYFCQFNATICLPLPCELDIIYETAACVDLAARYSNSTYNITEAQFFSWNENIQGSCDGVAVGERVCKGAPGGTYPTPTASIHAPTATNEYYTTASHAVPTQSGSIADCGNYYQVVSGDNCNNICLRYGINFTQLQQFNQYLNNDCTNLWLNYDVCVAKVTPSRLSADGTCGLGVTCTGTNFGSCCSTSGFCGSDSPHCDAGNCQSGACDVGNSMATTNGTCGPLVGGLQCTNPSFGPCCSIYGYCGNGTDFCGAGKCYSGACATDNGGPSTNGECGPNFAGNKTCTGTQFGNCCSVSGYCGSSSDYCSGAHCYSGACTT